MFIADSNIPKIARVIMEFESIILKYTTLQKLASLQILDSHNMPDSTIRNML